MKRAAVEKVIAVRRAKHAAAHLRKTLPLGYYRKSDPWDCGNAQCFVCHCEKVMGKPKHADLRRAGVAAPRHAKDGIRPMDSAIEAGVAPGASNAV